MTTFSQVRISRQILGCYSNDVNGKVWSQMRRCKLSHGDNVEEVLMLL